MKLFKGFAQIGPLSNNNQGVVAPIGEISPISLTFTREKSLHTDATYGELLLIGFSYKEDEIVTPVPDATAEACLRIMDWVYQRSQSGVLTASKDSFQQLFIQEMGSEFDLIESGTHVEYNTFYAPEYVIVSPYQESTEINWKIWFSDEAFYNQFDETEIKVIHPIENVDLFIDSFFDVQAVVSAISIADIITRTELEKSVYPFSVMRADTFEWRDPINPDNRFQISWTTLIYGEAGNNADSVKTAIQNAILANSQYDRETWADYFPDLFTSTEFIITPFWHKYSVPDMTRESGVHAGAVGVLDAVEICRATGKGTNYTDTHVSDKLAIAGTQYKSIMLGIVGGPDNLDGIDEFYKKYPDYMNVPTTHLDFYRMSAKTREFYMILAGMLEKAESLTSSAGIPRGYNRLIRDGVVYLALTHERFLYLVVSKESVLEIAETLGQIEG